VKARQFLLCRSNYLSPATGGSSSRSIRAISAGSRTRSGSIRCSPTPGSIWLRSLHSRPAPASAVAGSGLQEVRAAWRSCHDLLRFRRWVEVEVVHASARICRPTHARVRASIPRRGRRRRSAPACASFRRGHKRRSARSLAVILTRGPGHRALGSILRPTPGCSQPPPRGAFPSPASAQDDDRSGAALAGRHEVLPEEGTSPGLAPLRRVPRPVRTE
jgi:hypothetical protein